ncbi:hypothetical protein [Rhodococcus pyridinivorans]|uniref:hypothetical protein n=1 Tax=Rhodococcus pyridinivorans TaxID=103816 RepID=UPI00110FFF25|nr:hypothetical protein [Rhodococcus pyridinivorans]MCD2141091.1 hypothetical protein [Rhodococcus pyridinivorans]
MISEFSRSPLLSSQRVVESLFHRNTVVCEADSDRAFYQTVAEHSVGQTATLFVNAQNKQTVSVVVKALAACGVESHSVVDIDILNSRDDLAALMAAHLVPKEIRERAETNRAKAALSIESVSDQQALVEISESVKELHEQLDRGEHTLRGARSALDRIRRVSKWSSVKKGGLDALNEDIRKEVSESLNELKKYGIHIVPCGELESWLDIKVSKKNWTPQALDAILDGAASEQLIQFVSELVILNSSSV